MQSNTTIWWLDICCLLHRYQLHVSALKAIFRLIDWQQTCKQLYFDMRLVYGGGGLGLDVDVGTRSRVWASEHSTTNPVSRTHTYRVSIQWYKHTAQGQSEHTSCNSIQQDSAQNHTNTHALFRENPGRQPGQNIINAPLSTKDHSIPQTVEIYTRNVQPPTHAIQPVNNWNSRNWPPQSLHFITVS